MRAKLVVPSVVAVGEEFPIKVEIQGGMGYETRTAQGSKLAPEALDMIVEATVGLLKEVFGP